MLTPSTAYEPLDSGLPNVEPLFDFSSCSSNAHVNVGIQYQARIPAFNPNKEDAKLHYRSERADRVWCPSILERLTFPNQEDARKCKAIVNSKRKMNMLKELDLYIELSTRFVFSIFLVLLVFLVLRELLLLPVCYSMNSIHLFQTLSIQF